MPNTNDSTDNMCPVTTKKLLKGVPTPNTVTRDEFQERVHAVFLSLREILSKSFGAYGASTIIANQANSTVTKDGYTIMKNIQFDTHEGSIADNVIYNMASDICARLNYKVGDGTTTAIIAATSIYDAYMEKSVHDMLESNGFLPRDILREMKDIQKELVEKLVEKSTPIRDQDCMVDKIHDIVNISSNGNTELTDMITSIYHDLETPSINCEIAKDGITKMNIVEGYQGNIVLTDKVYVNSEGNTMIDDNLNVIVFDHKVTGSTYDCIIKPLNDISYQCGYRLVVIAPYFDQVTLETVIRRDLMTELNKRKKINLVLLVASNANSFAKKSLNDLSMLLGSTLIDIRLENELISKIQQDSKNIYNIMDISGRHIKGLKIAVYANPDDTELTLLTDDGVTEYKTPLEDDAVTVGFIDHIESNLTKTIFNGFHFKKEIYDIYLNDAKNDVTELTEKYSAVGNFSYDVARAQKRYNSLLLKMAEIEVGGDSELSKHLLKDVVDDSILAAESAYNHGYILGCNVTTIIAIEELLNEYLNKDIDPAIKLIKISILNILHKGFVSVYSQVLENGWGDITINLDPNVYINSNLVDICNEMIKSINKYMNTETGMDPVKFSEIFNKLVGKTQEEYKEWSKSLKDGEELKPIAMSVNMILICYSEYTNQVFDLVEKRFSDRIINSTNTDIQVLTASMDLLSILVNGNQLVLTIKDNF